MKENNTSSLLKCRFFVFSLATCMFYVSQKQCFLQSMHRDPFKTILFLYIGRLYQLENSHLIKINRYIYSCFTLIRRLRHTDCYIFLKSLRNHCTNGTRPLGKSSCLYWICLINDYNCQFRFILFKAIYIRLNYKNDPFHVTAIII